MDPFRIPFIPENAPFTVEQRAWLNGFLAGLFSQAQLGVPPVAPTAPPKPSDPLLILFGSQTGTAEGLAKRIARQSQSRGFAPTVLPLNDFAQGNLIDAKNVLVVSSTWGDGDPPDNATEFWRWLSADSAPRLENLHFAVLGLGDRNYADFCGASRKFETRLTELGAQCLMSRGECDVDYEAPANAWCDQLWARLQPSNSTLTNGTPAAPVAEEPATSTLKFGRTNPFPAPVLQTARLSKSASAKEVRHYELSLAGSELSYEAGDALGIVPENCPQLVEGFLGAIGCQGDDQIEFGGSQLTWRILLLKHADISRPTPDLLATVAAAAPDCELAPLLHSDKTATLKKWLFGRDVVDVLRLLGSPLAPETLVKLLRKLAPRLYSISSSPKAHPGEVHITVGTVRYEAFGRPRKGVCSTFLSDRCKTAPVFVHSSPGFKPPANPELPMIMIGPGTGIAPFRAFLEERQATGARGRNWLFFGDQTRQADFLYEEQITQWHRQGHLSRLDLAFSRDQEAKLYVQHRMLENASELWGWLEDGAHFYVCGDASRMASDVDQALHKVIESAGGKSPEEAKAYVAKLKSTKRYQRDVY